MSATVRPPRPPLPERIRPAGLADVVGQGHLLGPQGIVSRLIAAGALPSIVLWGPPGCGKTTIARLLAQEMGLRFTPFSAVLGGVPELRAVLEEARKVRELGQGTLLFVDELHRFNKGQQDALLPHVEAGAVTLVGATTENPSFALNKALVSRVRVFSLHALDEPALDELLTRVRTHPEGLPDLEIDAAARSLLLRLCSGDGRRMLMLLEAAHAMAGGTVTAELVAQVAQNPSADHDRAGEAHYDVASAFIKSMRASDVQAALYYLARQLESGEDPLFVARRVVIFSCEDVGLADPQALQVAMSAHQAVAAIGMPEAIYPLTQAVVYCATAPKSNATKGYFAAAAAVRERPGAQVPMFLRNAPTGLMKDLGYGTGYVYDHDTPDHFAGQRCLPEELAGRSFYEPGGFGFEKEIRKRLEWWEARRKSPG
ncbi:MAG: replication-associated recombination protein A [Planctomycetes bacterium]|nr:replication-associated recombination protein A [Planctomycetota bacterium]